MAVYSRGSHWIQMVVAASVAAVSFVACSADTGGGAQSTPAANAAAEKASVSPVERGKYLVTIGGCNDCHTPWKMGPAGPEPDMTRMLSGQPAETAVTAAPAAIEAPWGWAGSMEMTAFAGPWGVSFSANLTPDPVTGLGSWSEAVFIATMRNGKHLGTGRPILPPMPWQGLSKATDEDLAAMFAYLQSIPAIENRVPAPIPPAGAAMDH